MSTLLVVACSGFSRRAEDPAYGTDRALYLKQQHHSLSRLSYSCDVVLVNNGGVPDYLEYLDTLRGTYRVLDRENRGMSLGALSDAWKTHPDYDYYILLEDDYVFVLDYFDEEMEEMIGAVPDCGYMCQVADTAAHDCLFPSFMNGIATSALMNRLGGFLQENQPSNHAMGDQMQKDFGTQIRETRQFTLADMGSRFKAPFAETRGHTWNIVEYYPEAPYLLLVPSQIYTREV